MGRRRKIAPLKVLENLAAGLRGDRRFQENVFRRSGTSPSDASSVTLIRKAMLDEAAAICEEIAHVWTPLGNAERNATYSYRGPEDVPWDYLAAFERGRFAAAIAVRQEGRQYVLILTVGWNIDEPDDGDDGGSRSGTDARVAVFKPSTETIH